MVIRYGRGERLIHRAELSLALVALAAAACGEAERADPGAQTFDDPRGRIEVAAGSDFAISLPANPSTGYDWRLADSIEGPIVDYAGSDYHPEPGSENRIGAGGRELLSFRALRGGQAKIDLEYAGPGRDAPIGQRRAIEVSVRP